MPASQSSTVGRPLPQAVVRIFGDLHLHTDGNILGLAAGQDGTCWTIEAPGTLRQWRLETGSQVGSLTLSDVEVLWAIDQQGRLLAAGSDDLSIWDIATGKMLFTRHQPSWISALAFDLAGELLATGHDDGQISIWPLRGVEGVESWPAHEEPLSAMAFSPDGSQLAAASEDRTIRIWDVSTGRMVSQLTGHTDRIQALAWHPTGQILVSAGWDTMARVWDAKTGEPIILLNGHGEVVSAAAFSPDGKLLATADSEQVIWIWDHAAGKPIHRLRGHAGEVSALVFLSNRKLLSGGQDRRVMLWDVEQGRSLSGTADPNSETARIALHPGGKLLAYLNGSPMLRIWDCTSGAAVLQHNHSAGLTALTYSPDGSTLAVGDDRGNIALWKNGSKAPTSTFAAHKTAITALVFRGDGAILASAGATDGYVYLWSVAAQEPQLLIPEATAKGTVESIAWVRGTPLLLAGGVDWLAAGPGDGQICIWDTQKPGQLAMLEGGTTRLAIRPDGKQFASNSLSDTVAVWDVGARKLQRELGGHGSFVTGLAYAPDGKLLATCCEEGVIRLWDIESGALVKSVELGTRINDIVFAPDGKLLYAANAGVTCYAVSIG